MTQELTTTEIKAKIRLFAWPITLSMLVAQLYSVIDMAVIGRFLGANELAAVGNAANVIMVFLAISGGLEMAVEIIVSQLIGQKNQDSLAQTTRTVLAFDGICGIIVAILGIFCLPAVFHLISVPDNLMRYALIYGRIYLAGLFLIHVYDGGRAILTAAEDTKKSFYLMLTTTVLNLIFNLLFIVGLKLGVAGSAMGTVLAQLIGALLTLKLLDDKFHFAKCSGRIFNAKRSSYRFANDFPAVRRNVWRRAHSKFRQSVRTRGHHRLRRNSSHHELFQNRFGGTGTNLDRLRGPAHFGQTVFRLRKGLPRVQQNRPLVLCFAGSRFCLFFKIHCRNLL